MTRQVRNKNMISPTVWLSILLVVVTLSVFWRVWDHEFINYDDDYYVTNNRHVLEGITLSGLVWAFTEANVGNWHPITWLSHMADIELFGLHAGAHHMTSVSIHILCALVLFFVLLKMTCAIWPSALTAFLFALHPMHVESVAWVAERKDVLSALFWMLSLYFYALYAERHSFWRYFAVLSFFVLSLMSKPMAVTFPFVLLLLDYWPLNRLREFGPVNGHGAKNEVRKRSFYYLVLEKAPLLAIAAICGLITFNAQRGVGAVRSWTSLSLDSRVANAMVSYVEYIGKMFVPLKLAVFYPFPESISLWKTFLALIFLILCTYLAFRYAREKPYVLVGWLWFLGTLVPVIGLLQVGSQGMADRYSYIPFIGLFIAISWTLAEAARKKKKRYVAAGAVLAVTVLAILSYRQVGFWKNSLVLFHHAIEVTDNNYVAHNNLAQALAERGYVRAAIANYQSALAAAPEFTDFHRKLSSHNLALLFDKMGKYKKAESLLLQVLRMEPEHIRARNDLGAVLLKMGRISEAIEHFKIALRFAPNFAPAKNNLKLARELLRNPSMERKNQTRTQ